MEKFISKFHRLKDCGEKPTCSQCMPIMVKATMARSPMAIMINGFEQVFESQRGFKPDKKWLDAIPTKDAFVYHHATFRSSSSSEGAPGWKERSGQEVMIIYRLTEAVVDEEVGAMYKIRFSDGTLADAFEDELEGSWKSSLVKR